MTSELLFILAMLVLAVIAAAVIRNGINRQRLNRAALDPLRISPEDGQGKPREPERSDTASDPRDLTAEDESKAELERLQKLIRDRKKIAWETDISYHLWNLYKSHFRSNSSQSLDYYNPDGSKWYDLKILQSSSKNNLNKFEFELNGARFKFVDDEERQGWCENMKYFNLFLYDDSERCLIDIPMKLRVDRWGKNYSISSDSPIAFIPGNWINEFVNATLKQQSIRNQEIRAQKHQERLWEIQELKDRFGISD